MIRRASAVFALVSLAWGVDPAAGQPAEELVYVGTPQVKYSGAVGELSKESLPPAAAVEYAVRIVRRGNRYYWASRDGRELSMSKGGVYVTFSCEAGFIKVINPAFDAMRKDLKATDPSERFDYVEVMHTQLGAVIYWGTGSGLPI